MIFYRNSGPDTYDFKAVEIKKLEGLGCKLSWASGGNLLAVTTVLEDSETNVEIYRVTTNNFLQQLTKWIFQTGERSRRLGESYQDKRRCFDDDKLN